MNREEFLKLSALLGIGAMAAPSLLTSCKKEEGLTVNFNGKVLIIGAGAAGMIAAYTLHQHGIDYEILEAHDYFGGRVKLNDTLADFPIDIGAEWIHTGEDVFQRLINDKNATGSVELVPYQLETIDLWDGQTVTPINSGNKTYGERKFKSTTWHQFFSDFIVPHFGSKLHLSSPVASIDYSGSKVVATTNSGQTYAGDKVIVTVPINVLQAELINFRPALPNDKMNAVNGVDMPDGIKVFIKFKERFYPDILSWEGLAGFNSDGRLYYDAAFKKDSQHNIMGLFNVGGIASQLTNLTDQEIVDQVLSDLDKVYEGKATLNYESHVIQNWSADPYTLGAYSFHGNNYDSVIDSISAPVDSKVYFAGEALNKNEWSTVHGAGFNGREVAEGIITGG